MLLEEHSLPVGLLFGILLSVGRNRSPVGNNVVTRERSYAENLSSHAYLVS